MSLPFAVSVRSAGATTVIEVRGDLDLYTAEQAEPALAAVAPATPTCVDLTRCDYIDSAGLHLLRTYTQNIGPAYVTLVVSPDSPIRRVLAITGLDRFFQVAPEPPR